MATLFLKRTLAGVDVSQGEIPASWKIGQEARADIFKPRSLPFHKKAFALLDIAFPHTDYPSKEALRNAVTVGAGFMDPVVNPMTGETVFIAKSWSFEKMDNFEFAELYSRMIDVVLKIIPGSTRDDWEQAERQIIGF